MEIIKTERHDEKPVWAIVIKDTIVFDPYTSECGRFESTPEYYGLTEEQAQELIALNERDGYEWRL